MDISSALSVATSSKSLSEPAKTDALHIKARELEAAFLSEMLTAAGVGKPSQSFGGGAGEEAFSSFMVREYAASISERGGIGLAESIVKALAGEKK